MTLMTHISVLSKETIDALNLKPGSTVLDGTFGGGGHSRLIASNIGKNGTLIALDKDRSVFHDALVTGLNMECQFHFATENFRYLDEVLRRMSAGSLDAAVFDLGISSIQLDDSGRGFTFQKDEPLRMTMSVDDEALTAETVVNEWEEETLVTILEGFAEETFAKRIAHEIVKARALAPIQTTFQLVEVIKRATPFWYHHRRIHPATKTFQAIRMAVNGELDAITEGIPKAINAMRSGGRIAIISFHSVEDRVVKRLIKQEVEKGIVQMVNKKPIVPSEKEVSENPRSRSAKLRIIEKL